MTDVLCISLATVSCGVVAACTLSLVPVALVVLLSVAYAATQ